MSAERDAGATAAKGSICLQLDVGNSSAKWRLCEGTQILSRGRYVAGDESSREELLNCTATLQEIWIASVASAAQEQVLQEMFEQRWGIRAWFARSQGISGDLRNSYAEPERMGVDRWVAMLAARRRCQRRVCVIDSGSALTIDVVAADGQHEGGYIIPGAALMERALLLDTDRVRFAEDVGYQLHPGQSTAEAVRHGVALAQAGAVAAVVARMAKQPAALMFCGGGGSELKTLADCGGELVPDLVFEGLGHLRGLAEHA